MISSYDCHSFFTTADRISSFLMASRLSNSSFRFAVAWSYFFFTAITSASAFSIFSSNACYQGYSLLNDKNERVKFTFAKGEKAYYVEKYSDHVDGQNEKNRKARYYDRVKTIDGILENNKMCPEETLLQLENIDGTVLADVLAQISAEYSFQTIAGCSYNN